MSTCGKVLHTSYFLSVCGKQRESGAPSSLSCVIPHSLTWSPGVACLRVSAPALPGRFLDHQGPL